MGHATTFFPGAAVQQIGYATTDVVETVKRYRERYGIREFLMLPNTVSNISPGRTATINVAMAFVNGTMIELIEPAGGADSIYRDVLPSSGYAVRHHHLGYAMFNEPDWQSTQREIERQKISIVLEGESPGVIRYQYIDLCADIGHYVEYLYYLGDGGRELLEAIPRNS
jgi:Glyoxalase/Bleomycin resistance protein/Dioxygenase superfamily